MERSRHDATTPRREPGKELDEIAEAVLDCAFEVHRRLGAGFLEAVYEAALCLELEARGIPFERQAPFSVVYKGYVVGEGRVDLLVADEVVVELKAVAMLAPVHTAQMISYLTATGCTLGLLINFDVPLLRGGIRRIIRSP